LRALAGTDFPDLRRWLSDPRVAAWWRAPDPGLEASARKYTPLVDGTDPGPCLGHRRDAGIPGEG